MSEEKKEYLDKDGVKEFKNLINKQFTNEIETLDERVGEMISDINSSMSDYGLNNVFDGELRNGYFNDNGATYTESANDVCGYSLTPCSAGDVVTVKNDLAGKDIYIKFFDSSNNILLKKYASANELTLTAPTNSAKFAWSIAKTNITPSQAGHIGVYINNQIDVVMNDFDVLSGEVETLKTEVNNNTNAISEIKSDLEEIFDYTLAKDLFTTEEGTRYRYLDVSGNLKEGSGDYSVSKFIAIESGKTYRIVNENRVSLYSCFYDSSKTFVSSTLATNKDILVANNVAYIRFTYLTNNSENTHLYSHDVGEAIYEINSSMSDYGLNNVFDGEFLQGGMDSGTIVVKDDYVITKNKIYCSSGDFIKSFGNSLESSYACFYKSDNTYIGGLNALDGCTAPSDSAYCYVEFKRSGITPSTSGHIGVYVNNQIDVLENSKASSNHTHDYLPLSGGTIDGKLNVNGNIEVSGTTTLNDYVTIAGTARLYNELIINKNYSVLSDNDRGNTYNLIKLSTDYGQMYNSTGSTGDGLYGTTVGNATFNTRVESSGYIYFNGSFVSSSSGFALSDEKIKSFTDDIDNDKDNIIKLFDLINVKSYTRKDAKTSNKDILNIGVSAQELEESILEVGLDNERYNIIDNHYDYMMSRGENEEDAKYYTKFMTVNYDALYTLSLIKMRVMEETHNIKLRELEERISKLENK